MTVRDRHLKSRAPSVAAALLLLAGPAWAQTTTASAEQQIVISGTISTLPFSGCPSVATPAATVPAFQVDFLDMTVGVSTDATTVVHDRTLTGNATGSAAVLQAGQFVDVVGTVAGSCLLADRIVIRSSGHLVVRGAITSVTSSRIVVQGATFVVDSSTRIVGPGGSAATLTDLTVGTFVVAGGPLEPDGTYRATRVQIGPEFDAEGPITAVGTGPSTITVGGQVISVPSTVEILQRSANLAPEETVRGGGMAHAVPGGQPGDVSLLQVGTVVGVYGRTGSEAAAPFTANRIYVFGQRRATFEGTVSQASGTTFHLDVLQGVSIPVSAASALVRGRIANGATAVVVGQFNTAGGLDAISVVVRSRIQLPPMPFVRGLIGPAMGHGGRR